MDLLSLLIGFVLGAFTGAAGNYLGSKYTDKRKSKEQKKSAKRQWKDLEQRFPAIINEMKIDVRNEEFLHVRAFFVKSSKTTLNGGGPCFEYHTDVHPDIEAAISHLEHLRYIEDITTGNCPKYQMTEKFVDLLRLS